MSVLQQTDPPGRGRDPSQTMMGFVIYPLVYLDAHIVGLLDVVRYIITEDQLYIESEDGKTMITEDSLVPPPPGP